MGSRRETADQQHKSVPVDVEGELTNIGRWERNGLNRPGLTLQGLVNALTLPSTQKEEPPQYQVSRSISGTLEGSVDGKFDVRISSPAGHSFIEYYPGKVHGIAPEFRASIWIDTSRFDWLWDLVADSTKTVRLKLSGQAKKWPDPHHAANITTVEMTARNRNLLQVEESAAVSAPDPGLIAIFETLAVLSETLAVLSRQQMWGVIALGLIALALFMTR